jgi:hypothetical protein
MHRDGAKITAAQAPDALLANDNGRPIRDNPACQKAETRGARSRRRACPSHPLDRDQHLRRRFCGSIARR